MICKKCIDRLHNAHGDLGEMKNKFERMLLEFCLEKELYMSNTWLKRKQRRKWH